MEWREQGIVLATRRHGESAAILEVMTAAHGRHVGVVRGGAGRRLSPVLQPGAQLDLTWKARLEDHIGAFTVEPVRSRAGALGDPLALSGMSSVVALLSFALPERDPHPGLYDASVALLDMIAEADTWLSGYLRWEMALLEDLGFGLDLSACAVTGVSGPLIYVSPRTGRAVSAAGAGDWAARLLPLPASLRGEGDGSPGDIREGLAVTGHFLQHHLAAGLAHKPLPQARARLLDRLARHR
ncbi:DNA repair protein RecO [Poseidonocella sedimentorum]|uniref:DNA repair protein RecO n=1 Tax=Poseidonocella sedimentorum TaxID=871652 RepID=A0A1I6D314_9RHOB|nr:DNA repair protein RecO [Poseidonocella sedimentorum]SFQ99874.1 DNA replication and repair protein RecO [Poseidonocella sedimentorum]